jgi:peptide/nickel transport system permease protein
MTVSAHPLAAAALRFSARPTAMAGLIVLAALLGGGSGLTGDPAIDLALGGAPSTLGAAFGAALVAGALGIVWGALAILAGGVDTGRRLRGLPLALAAALTPSLFGGGLPVLILAAGLAAAPTVAIVANGAVRGALRRDYVMAARAQGESETRILLDHVLPAVSGPLLVAVWRGTSPALLAVVLAGLIDARASELGVSWGLLLSGRASASVAVVAAVLVCVAMGALGAVAAGLATAARLEVE